MNDRPSIDELFERRVTYPDCDMQDRLSRLVGLENKLGQPFFWLARRAENQGWFSSIET
jgi:hypothetical protein